MRKRLLLFVFGAIALQGLSVASAQPTSSQPARRTAVVDVFENTRDAVVNIAATQVFESTVLYNNNIFDDFFGRAPQRPQSRRYTRSSIGSGFVIHPDGYVVTNAHVLQQAAVQKVIFADKKEYDAEQVAIDEKHDLAVLRIKADKSFPALKLGRSDDIMIGETVIAIGNPLGYEHTVTAGIISALNRTLQLNENMNYEGLIQTDASINRGNSGGPLLNVLGELIGVNTAIRGDAQNIGFAIPVDALRKLLPDMLSIEHGPKRLEVGLRLRWRNRLYVVESRGPAEEAGIEPGDEVVGIAGMPLKNEVDYYIYLQRIKQEDRVVVEIKRDEKLMQKVIQPKSIPIPDGAKLLSEKFGFAVQLLTQEQLEQLDLKAGLIITDVEPNSPAAQAGFERGLVVAQVGQHFPNTLEEIALLLENVASNDKLMFRVYRVQRQFLQVYAVALTAR